MGEKERNASVYMVEEPWVSGELTWANQPDATIPVAEDISHNNQTKYVFSCTDAVRYWYDDDPHGLYEKPGYERKFIRIVRHECKKLTKII